MRLAVKTTPKHNPTDPTADDMVELAGGIAWPPVDGAFALGMGVTDGDGVAPRGLIGDGAPALPLGVAASTSIRTFMPASQCPGTPHMKYLLPTAVSGTMSLPVWKDAMGLEAEHAS